MSKVLDRIRKRIPSYKKRMVDMSMAIVSQINDYMRETEGMNQRKLAEKLGKSESEISKWLSGGHNFTIETIAKVEDVFGKPIITVPKFAEEELGIEYKKVISEGIDIMQYLNTDKLTPSGKVVFVGFSEGFVCRVKNDTSSIFRPSLTHRHLFGVGTEDVKKFEKSDVISMNSVTI